RWPRDWSSDVCSSDLIERCYWRLIARLVSKKPAPCGRAIGSVWNSEREPYGELHTTWITLQRGDAPESRVRRTVARAIVVRHARSEERRVGKEWRCLW